VTREEPQVVAGDPESERQESGEAAPFARLTDGGPVGDDPPRPDAVDEASPNDAVDPDEDARRGEPLVTETDAGTRIWATGWYRVRPRTFVHHELFFDPAQVACVYAEESYKSYLLRRSGREQEAARIGRDRLQDPPDALLDHSRSFGICVTDIDHIEVRSGSLLFKPKLVITTSDHTYEFRHWRRTQNTGALAAALRDVYSFPIEDQ
jgi:hypothetical protein